MHLLTREYLDPISLKKVSSYTGADLGGARTPLPPILGHKRSRYPNRAVNQ